MAMSPEQLMDLGRREFPPGVQGKRFEQQMLKAIENGLAYGSARFRERVDYDIWGNGSRTRFELPGVGIRVMDENDQLIPSNLSMLPVSPPTINATYTIGTGGALRHGTYWACYAWKSITRTPVASDAGWDYSSATGPIAIVVSADSSTIIRGDLTAITPAGLSVGDFISIAPYSGEMHLGAANSTSAPYTYGANTNISSITLPAPVDFTPLASLDPIFPLEAGIGADGVPDPTVSTLTVGTAPDGGARVRVPYTRTARMPATLNTLINLDDDYLRLTFRTHLCLELSLSTVSGDSTDWNGIWKTLQQELDALILGSAGRRAARVKFVQWA